MCQRLISCGYYDYRPGEPVGNKLLLDTIFDRTWDQTKHKHKFKTLKLLPHPEPEALAAIPTSRVRKITVVHYDGRAAAKTIGVTVENKCSPSQLAAAVGAVLQPPLGASERILIMQGTTSNMHVNTYHLADDRQLGDGSFAHVRTWAFRVPKPSRPSSAHPSDSYATPEYLIISNHRGSDYDGRNELHPVVLPISAEHLRGGAAANKAVADALARAVQPYLKPGQLAVKVPFTLKRCGYQHEQMGPFCEARGAPLRALSPGNGSYVAPLDACWREQQATMYDLAVFASPAVDDSASADALKETVEREEALRKRWGAMAGWWPGVLGAGWLSVWLSWLAPACCLLVKHAQLLLAVPWPTEGKINKHGRVALYAGQFQRHRTASLILPGHLGGTPTSTTHMPP